MARKHSRSLSGIAFAYAVLVVSAHGQATNQGASVLPVQTTAKLYNGIFDDIVGDSLNFFATASARINPECRSLVTRGAFDHAHSTIGVGETMLELSKLELSTAVQLLELSVVFMDRGEFPLAKSILALCACSFGPGLSETYIRSSQLRWRMGLHHLDPLGIDDWLGWKKLLPAIEEERIEELSFLAYYSINKIGLVASCATCICSFILILISSPLFAHAFNVRKRLAKLWRKTAQDCAHATEATSPLRILEDHTEYIGHSLFLQNPSTMLVVERTIHLYSLSQKDSTCLADSFRVTSAESSNKTARGIAKEFAQMTEYFEDAASVVKCTEKSHIRVESVYASSEQSTHEGSEAFHSDLSSENVEADIVRELPRYAAADVRFWENVGKSDVPLAEQVRALSKEAFGEHEDAMQTRKNERICAMLVGEKVVSYASYTLRRNLMALSINKFAVACAEQRRGLGRIMIRHLIQIAKRRSRADTPVAVLSLSALAASVGFYRACGFHEDSSVRSCSSDDAIEGQVYMEYTLKRKRSK